MCLLAVLFQVHPDAPLVVAANRDEWLARPAEPMRVLRAVPRTLGGRDVEAGGTWLATNGAGVVAGLTNQPSAGGRQPGRRTRGELPILFTAEADAEVAVRLNAGRLRCEDYSPCWLLVGDREALFFVTIEGRGPPRVQPLAPGVHVLENRPLLPASPKARRVAEALAEATTWRGDALVRGLAEVLRLHDVPDGGEPPAVAERAPRPDALARVALGAPCVHAGPYGTRSSSIVVVPTSAAAATPEPPRVHFADGPPCQAPFEDRSALWSAKI